MGYVWVGFQLLKKVPVQTIINWNYRPITCSAIYIKVMFVACKYHVDMSMWSCLGKTIPPAKNYPY